LNNEKNKGSMVILTICPKPGCNELVEDGGVCKKHAKKSNPSGRKSGDVQKWMNSARFRNRRAQWIKGKFCTKHRKEAGILVRADVLDHIVPHCGDYRLFWDESNWQGLCFSCHSKKTATEDGGFGNQRR
jgi:5-methylcytosine-specific restriction protein A